MLIILTFVAFVVGILGGNIYGANLPPMDVFSASVATGAVLGVTIGLIFALVFFMLARAIVLLLKEYSVVLAGLFIGFVTAVISVYPVIHAAIQTISLGFVGSTMAIIFINGVIWIVVLAALQLRKINLIDALRND